MQNKNYHSHLYFKILNKIDIVPKMTVHVCGGIQMTPPHLFHQMPHSLFEKNNCRPPICGELSEYTEGAHIEVEGFQNV